MPTARTLTSFVRSSYPLHPMPALPEAAGADQQGPRDKTYRFSFGTVSGSDSAGVACAAGCEQSLGPRAFVSMRNELHMRQHHANLRVITIALIGAIIAACSGGHTTDADRPRLLPVKPPKRRIDASQPARGAGMDASTDVSV